MSDRRDNLVYTQCWKSESHYNTSSTVEQMLHLMMSEPVTGKLLDLGCGIGRHVLAAEKFGIETVAVEKNFEGARRTSDAVASNSTKIEHSDITVWLDKNREQFHAILLFDVVHHIGSKRSEILNFLQSLKPHLLPEGFLTISFLTNINYGMGDIPEDRFLTSPQDATKILDTVFPSACMIRETQKAVYIESTMNYCSKVGALVPSSYRANRLVRLYKL